MKKHSLILITIILFPMQVLAAKDRDVRFTVHNLSNNTVAAEGITEKARNFMATDETQVCIFCHTPHNSSPNIPLWNKVVDATPFVMYTSSSTLSPAAKGAKILPDSLSLLCLSCHDGKTAINVVHNIRAGAGVVIDGDGPGQSIVNMVGYADDAYLLKTSTKNAPNLGAERGADGHPLPSSSGLNLADDHPVGFSYTDAQAVKSTDLRAVQTAKDNGVRFFGATSRMECSSCHDPHVFYGTGISGDVPVATDMPAATQAQLNRKPFLVRDNVGSGLCLSCHIK